MKNKYKFILLLIIITSVISFNYFLKHKIADNIVKQINTKRSFVDAILEKQNDLNTQASFIEYINPYLFIINEKTVTQIDATNFKTINQFNEKGIFRVIQVNDSIVFLNNRKHHLVYYVNNKKVKTTPLPNSFDNICNIDNIIFYETNYTNGKLKEFAIQSIDSSFNFNIYQLLDSSIKNTDSLCTLCYMEGRMINLDNKNILYASYKLSYVYVINTETKEVKSFKTIEPQKRVDVKSVKLKMGETEITSCQQEKGVEYLQSTFATNAKFLFVNSSKNIKDKGVVYTVFDVYDKKTFSYVKSIRFKISDDADEDMADARANDDYLFIVSSNNKLYKYKLPQL